MTGIGEQAVSVSYAAIQLLKQKITCIDQKQALIIGAGTMGKLAARHLKAEGCKLLFANRSFDKAAELAVLFNGSACSLQESFGLINRIDILICSVDKKDYLLRSSDMMEPVSKRNHPIYLIDLGVPRNVDPNVAEFDNVLLYDMDHLNGVIDSNNRRRMEESHKVRLMIKKELAEFNCWKQTLPVTVLIRELLENASQIEAEAIRKIENKLPDLTDRDRQIIHKFAKMISSQLTRQPILMLKEIASEIVDQDKKVEYLALASRILGLKSEVEFFPDMKQTLLNETLKETGS